MKEEACNLTYSTIKDKFSKNLKGLIAFYFLIVFCLIGIYAPFLASSKPFIVEYGDNWYFPLFRYLFYKGFFTKPLDIFFNSLMITTPLFFACFILFKKRKNIFKKIFLILLLIQTILTIYLLNGNISNPEFDFELNNKKREFLKKISYRTFAFDLEFMNAYAKLNLVLQYKQRLTQQEKFKKYGLFLESKKEKEPLFQGLSTLWQTEMDNEENERQRLNTLLITSDKNSESYLLAKQNLQYIEERRQWIISQQPLIHFDINPLISNFHFEDDAGGNQTLNSHLPFFELTRINRKDLMAALIFGVRISLIVGALSVFLSLLIGIPIGAFSGYYGGTFDIIVSRLLEIWEGMPTFFMLLMVVAFIQSKSIFLIIFVIGIFGWTGFTRFIRGEFLKQRNLLYVESCKSQGFSDTHIIFSQILPNALSPVITLLPFAIMGAITSEAGLSFLGLGEENSSSWGVLMDEGRTAFPSESSLLWPPAIALTLLLINIALIGDALRDALDPNT